MKRSAFRFQPQLKVDHHHVAVAPKLWVREIQVNTLMIRWAPHHQKKVENLPNSILYYIECSETGTVDYKTANVYTATQLIGRNNVIVVSVQKLAMTK